MKSTGDSKVGQVPVRRRGLDALRAIAALLVVFHHSCGVPIGVAFYDALLIFFRDYGRLGVDLFFILSGFCIHWGHSNAEKPFHVREYLFKRWWRIYPPYFFALSFAVLANLFTNYLKWKSGSALTMGNFGAETVLTHVFLIHNLFPATMTSISGPLWTIAVEMQFYLIYLIARRFLFTGRGWACVIALALFFHVAGWYVSGFHWIFDPFQPLRYWIEWILGAYLVYVVRKWPALAGRWPIWLFLCVACWFANYLLRAHDITTNFGYSRHMMVISFLFLVLIFLCFEKIWSLPGFRLLPATGDFSYSIYLIHFLIIDRVRAFIVPVFPEGYRRASASLSGVFFALAASYLFFKFFEEGFMKKSKQIGSNRVC